MASAAEQLAANLNFGVLAKATELKKRIWFTLGALIVYRLGTYIPLPGIDPFALEAIFQQQQGGILGMFDMFAGGALSRMTIFALNIMPYISASIIMQLMTSISPRMEQLKKEGESGRKKINQYTRYLTVLITTLQAYGIAVGLESMSAGGASAVIDPGWFFRFTTVVTLVGGTLFLMWLGEQITARGVGNGISLIIFSGIVANLPLAMVSTLELGRTGAMSPFIIVGLLVLAVAVIAFIVFIERAQRRIMVQYPKQQRGNKVFGGQSTHLPLKINTPGVIPPIFASSLLLLPMTLANFGSGGGAVATGQAQGAADAAAGDLGMEPGGGDLSLGGELSLESLWQQAGALAARGYEIAGSFFSDMLPLLGHGQPLYMALYAGLIIFFAFFYTAVVFNPEDTADNLKKYGGFVPGIRPGKNTAEYLDYVLTRLTAVGALYLVGISVMPEYLIAEFGVPFYFGGTSLLIVVTVTMDTVAQVQSHLLAHQYEGLIKKSKLRGRRG